VSLKGMIIRCSSIIPEIREAIFRCLVCGFCCDPIPVERGNFNGMFLLIPSVSDHLLSLYLSNVLLTIAICRTNNGAH